MHLCFNTLFRFAIAPVQVKADIAASFQYVACLHLTERVKRGVKWAREVVPDLRCDSRRHMSVEAPAASTSLYRWNMACQGFCAGCTCPPLITNTM